MSNKQLKEIAVGLVNFFGDNLANPEREPKRFEWQCKFYKYIIGQKPTTNPKGEPNGK